MMPRPSRTKHLHVHMGQATVLRREDLVIVTWRPIRGALVISVVLESINLSYT